MFSALRLLRKTVLTIIGFALVPVVILLSQFGGIFYGVVMIPALCLLPRHEAVVIVSIGIKVYFAMVAYVFVTYAMFTSDHCCSGGFWRHLRHWHFNAMPLTIISAIFWPAMSFLNNYWMRGWGLTWLDVTLGTPVSKISSFSRNARLKRYCFWKPWIKEALYDEANEVFDAGGHLTETALLSSSRVFAGPRLTQTAERQISCHFWKESEGFSGVYQVACAICEERLQAMQKAGEAKGLRHYYPRICTN